ncbi:MAG: pilus assembly protein PilM [Candidatus Omnitrophica bacterium]|nr:pilus assembly protein PilM [Candidatus Omnitrophota bacterium]
MAEDRRIGVFWGKTALSFVEAVSGKPGRTFSVPLKENGSGSASAGPFNTAGAETISLIQNVFRQQKIPASTVNLSLSAKDIIFRSFIIPWMQPNEIKGVVDFEASKYVPFALSELSFSFYPMTIVEGNIRRIRVIFVAIKKAVLEGYTKILEGASLRVNISEPGTLSLIRALVSKDLLPKDETIALIERGAEAGNIVVVDHCLSQFVREFQLRIPGSDQAPVDPQVLMARMTNEVRISLNYFNRQEERFKVKRVMFVPPFADPDAARRLEEDLRMPVASIPTESILAAPGVNGIDFLKAYGAAIHQGVTLPADLNFSEGKQKTIKTISQKPAVATPVRYKTMILTFLVCLPVVALPFFLSGPSVGQKEIQKKDLMAQLKSSKDVSAQKMKQDNEKITARMSYFKGLSVSSGVSSLLALISSLLPEGAWVDQLDIVYPDIVSSEKKSVTSAAAPLKKTIKPSGGNVTVDIKGYVYSSNPGEQFKLVNELLANFKGDKGFSSLFESINFETIQTKDFGKYPATFFFLKCR